MTSYFGKYRGAVTGNLDPMQQGRLQVTVPQVLGSGQIAWAMPCVPFGGSGVGLYAIPPVGANVWVEFEGGDPSHPVWTGVFWAQGEVPVTPATPDTKVLRTAHSRLVLDDGPGGGITIEPTGAAVPTRIRVDHRGIELTCGATSLLVGPDRVVVKNGATSLLVGPDRLDVKSGTSSAVLAADTINLGTGIARLVLDHGAAISAGAASVKLDAAKVTVNDGALEVL